MACNKLDIAYFRHLKKTEQCELTFLLQVNHEKFGYLNEEVRSIRKASDNVASLLQHTKNKVINIIQKKVMKDSSVNQSQDIDIKISLSRNEVNIKGDTTCLDLLKYRNKFKFVIFNHYYRLIVNAPRVDTMTLPILIYSEVTVSPSRLKGIYIDRELNKFTWSKSLDKVEWTEVGCYFHYITTEKDIGYYLKVSCVPKNSYNEGPPFEVISDSVVQVLSVIETFSFQVRHSYTANKLTGKNMRIVSYNTLADRYIIDNKFSYCDPKYLSIEYRKRLILQEILGYNADVICLQEVDASVYSHFFKEELKNHSYTSTFNKKGNRIPEGLACIYNKSRFKPISTKHIVLVNEVRSDQSYSELWDLIKRNKDLKEIFLKQNTSVQLTALKLEETDEVLVIVNTHLYYHYEASHIRLLQVAVALKFITKWCKRFKATESGRLSVIFCGDFNSRPDSGVYHFMTEGNLRNCKEELEKISSLSVSKGISNKYNFLSACGTPTFTNYTEDFKGCLDYIFVEKTNITVKSVVPFPNEPDLSINVALPNKNFPSDHIALIADLELN